MPQMPPTMGPGILQVLQQLLQSPAAVQGMQNFAQGMPPGQGIPEMAMQAGAQMPMPQGGGGPPMPPGAQMPPEEGEGPPPDDAEAMASDAIDSAGATWDGVDAPTKNDIQRLMEDPEGLSKSFDEHFGDGMAAKYTGQGDDEEAEGSSDSPEEEAQEPEY